MMQPLALASAAGASSAKINPMVLFTICDSYIRRNEGSDRIIGTLLGNITDGVANITNCYTVPHNESMDQVCTTDRRSSGPSHGSLSPSMHSLQRIMGNMGCLRMLQTLLMGTRCSRASEVAPVPRLRRLLILPILCLARVRWPLTSSTTRPCSTSTRRSTRRTS